LIVKTKMNTSITRQQHVCAQNKKPSLTCKRMTRLYTIIQAHSHIHIHTHIYIKLIIDRNNLSYGNRELNSNRYDK
jgi:hypothetical protein